MITISFKVIELIMEKTCKGTAYSHLYYKRELRNYYVTIPVILSAEPANVHDIGSAYKVVRIYAKSPYTDRPEKNHQKMVCISLKKSVFWLRGP